MTAHGFMTRSIHAGESLDPSTGAHGTPLYQNATYGFSSYERVESWWSGASHFQYARDGNPTVQCLEFKMAEHEGAQAAIATASGMAAISSILLHTLRDGGHLLASADLYAVTREFLLRDISTLGASVDLVDFTQVDAVVAAIRPETRVLFAETFSNPSLRVADLTNIGALARQRDIHFIVDNTFLSPALCCPIEDGADVVIHKATNYLSGHGNVLGGSPADRKR